MKIKFLPVILLILIIGSAVAISGCTSSGNNTTSSNGKATASNAINVENLKIVSQGYGSYDVKATITPNKDISYLEMVAIAYDSSGAVIERSPLVWNTNDAKSGQKYKVTGLLYISGGENPAKVDILIFDSPFAGGSESGNIFKQTVTV
jgi:hypothetical protein